MNRIGDNLLCTESNKTVVQIFHELQVDFILIGGLAVSWYCPGRKVDDMDLLINPTQENAVKVGKALSQLGYPGVSPARLCAAGVQVSLKKVHYAELLTPSVLGPTYESIAQQAILGRLFGIPTRIASVQSLIEMKKLAATGMQDETNKHFLDIEQLERLASGWR